VSSAFDRARAALDAAHAQDPRGDNEAEYISRIEAWVRRLVSDASPALLLAARAQHLERWVIPREDFPRDRSGYLKWRSAVHERQGRRAGEILAESGCDPSTTARVAALVGKALPRTDGEAQALEDAACLVFLETELAPFARDYPREKVVDVLRKTWRKMSPGGHAAASSLDLPPPLPELVAEAVG
jgi:hypothetical protein